MFEYQPNTEVKEVRFEKGKYQVKTATNKQYTSPHKPINCTGFTSGLSLVESLFKTMKGIRCLIILMSPLNQNLFLVGPQVKHGNALFALSTNIGNALQLLLTELRPKK